MAAATANKPPASSYCVQALKMFQLWETQGCDSCWRSSRVSQMLKTRRFIIFLLTDTEFGSRGIFPSSKLPLETDPSPSYHQSYFKFYKCFHVYFHLWYFIVCFLQYIKLFAYVEQLPRDLVLQTQSTSHDSLRTGAYSCVCMLLFCIHIFAHVCCACIHLCVTMPSKSPLHLAWVPWEPVCS